MKFSGGQSRLVKLQRPPPEIKIFLPGRSARSRTATRRPRFPASIAHIKPAAPAPKTMASNLWTRAVNDVRPNERPPIIASTRLLRAPALARANLQHPLRRIQPNAIARIEFVDWTIREGLATVASIVPGWPYRPRGCELRRSVRRRRNGNQVRRAADRAVSSEDTKRRKGVNPFRGGRICVFAILFTVGMNFAPGTVFAQNRAQGEFRLSQTTHWGGAILQEGNYQYSVEAESGPDVMHVWRKGGGLSGMFMAQS